MNQEVKYTILGHACLYVEYKSVRLLIDPWLYGSTYWRSWWNYPKVKENLLEKIKPTHIYITHLHWDHFHGPSLRKFEKYQPTIMLPFSCTKRMKVDVKRDFRFKNILELRHARNYYIGTEFKVTSYQFNPTIIDTSIVLDVNGIKILNANDVKVFGFSLDQIIKRHGDFDFVLRSHSSAIQIPNCIVNFDSHGLTRSQDDYSEEFIYFAKKVKAKYAIPFASSHIYLHRNSIEYNKFYNYPKLVKEKIKKFNFINPKCLLMPSGSSWSSKNGFSLVEHDYENIESHIKIYSKENEKKLERFYALEEKTKVNIMAFKNYFSSFFSSLRFIPLKIRFGFYIIPNNKDIGVGKLAIVDFGKRKTNFYEKFSFKEDSLQEEKLDFLITISPKVFNDCNLKPMYNCWGASKLMKIYLKEKKSLGKYLKFCTLIDLYENDGLPIWRIFSVRQFLTRLTRWREIIDMFIYFYVIKLKKKPIYYLWK